MTRFEIVPERSELTAEARSSLHPIHGECRGVSGWIDAVVTDGVVDALEPVNAHLELETGQLKADNPLIQREIQRRLDAQRFPTIRADVQQATGGPDRYQVKGMLSLHGVTEAVAGQAKVRVDGDTMTVDGELTLDIRAFRLDPPKLFGLRVYPDVAVRLRVHASRVD